MVNRALHTGFVRTLGLIASIVVVSTPLGLVFPSLAQGASWQWSAHGERERIVIQLDPNSAEQSTLRTSPTSLDVQLSGAATALNREGAAPTASGLVSGLDVQGNALRLTLRDPAFGYIVQRQNDRIVLEIFKDPFGARWQPSDTSSVALPASQAAVPAPATPQAAVPAPVPTPLTTSNTQQQIETATPATMPSGVAQAPVGTAQQPATGTRAPAMLENAPAQGSVSITQTSPAQGREQAVDQFVDPAGLPPLQGASPASTAPVVTAPQPVRQPASQQTQQQAVQNQPAQQTGQQASPQGSAPAPTQQNSQTAAQMPVQGQTTPPASTAETAVSGQISAPITSPPTTTFPEAGQTAPAGSTTTTVTTTTGQGQIVVPPTSGRDVRVNVQVNQPPAQTTTGTVHGTPAGMPGGTRASEAPLAVSSGGTLPVQADPPDSTLPSAADLSAMTQRIEQLPVQEAMVPPVADNTLLSTPAAPPPSAEELAAIAAQDAAAQTVVINNEAPSAPAQGGTTTRIVNDPGATAPVQGNTTVVVNLNEQPAAAQNTQTFIPEAGPETAVVEEPAVSPRLIEDSGSQLRARFNTQGPNEWPEEEALSSVTSQPKVQDTPPEGAGGSLEAVQTMTLEKPQAAPTTDAQPGAEATPVVEPEVIYVDEQGNPVAKPLDVNAKVAEARKLIQSMQYGSALEILTEVKGVPLPPEKREEVLYLISDAMTGQYNGRWLEGYEPITASTSEAMNANLRSPQVARALERLGMINLRTDNQQDAAGYFGVLRRQFPHDPKVPELYYVLGEDQIKKGQYAEAVQNFQLVMQEYPESQSVKMAARFMAEALYKQGHYERALAIIDFVDRRWPRIYLDDPSYLLMVADTQFRRGRLEDALQTYWIYYNLLPNSPTNDQLLLNMGTIYLMLGDIDTSNALYTELLRRYPDSQYASLAVLRQGEEGIFEGNLSVDDLFAMFSRPDLRTLPEISYNRLINDYPNSEEAVAASLRLAAWKLWNREYEDAMEQAERFIQNHGDTPYASRADEIVLRALSVELAMDLEEQNYDRILSRWERFPQMRGMYGDLDDEMRIALARAHINRGNENDGFTLLEPFLHRPQDPKYGEYVYKLSLARALRTEDWQGIVDLGDMVKDWTLPQDEHNQLVYAMAIARENINQGQEAVPLWEQLYKRDDIPLYQKAYANYFMARDAERRRSIPDAYELNKATLDLFTRLGIENPERADPARVQESLVALMDVTEVANRFAEALEWAEDYSPYVTEESPEYAAFRFRLARLHRKMGDLIRWQYMLEGIIEREPDTVFGQMAASELRTHQVARDLTRFAPD